MLAGVLSLRTGPALPGSFDHACHQTLKRRGHTLELLDSQAIRTRFPQWSDVAQFGYYNPRGGWVESGRATRLFADLAQAEGVEFICCSITSLIMRDSTVLGVRLQSGDELTAEWVLLAAGAWTPALLPHLSSVLSATAQVVHHFAPNDAASFRPPSFPPYLANVEETGFYGAPRAPHYGSY